MFCPLCVCVPACLHAQDGVAAFIGPLSSTSTKAVTAISGALHLPQVAPIATNPMLGKQAFQQRTLVTRTGMTRNKGEGVVRVGATHVGDPSAT